MSEERSPTRRLLYGRRRPRRLRPVRQRLLAERLPDWSLVLPDAGRLDLSATFPGYRRFALEIGFGAGEHLVAQAAAHSEIGFIGCEPFLGGVARLLGEIENRGLANLRIVVDDTRLLLPALPDGSLDRIFLLFPDPWPKARHHKRRIVNPATAAEFARVLRPGGELRLATDDMGYAQVMLLTLGARPELCWRAARPGDWRARPPDWPPTRYEQKARATGRACVYLRFGRRQTDINPGEKILKRNPGERI